MSITVKRNTSWLDISDRFTLRLNGEAVTKIKSDEEIRLNIPREGARLKVKGFGYKSNEIEVKDGDVVEIATSKSKYVSFILSLVYIVFLASLPTPEKQVIVLTFLFVACTFIFFLTYTHQLEIIETKTDHAQLN